MKIREEYKVREMAGEHVVVMQGRLGVDMTKIISLNESALYLWNASRARNSPSTMRHACSPNGTRSTTRPPHATPRRGSEKLRDCKLILT